MCQFLTNTAVSEKKGVKTWLIEIIGRAKRAPHWGVQSRFRVIYIYIYKKKAFEINAIIQDVGLNED